MRHSGEIDYTAFDGAVFDVDGTLADSEAMYIDVTEQAIRLIGDGTISSETAVQMRRAAFGRSEPDMCSVVYGFLKVRGLTDRVRSKSDSEFFDEFMEIRMPLFRQWVESGRLNALPGAVDLVKNLYSRFGPLGVATGSTPPINSLILDDFLRLSNELPRNLRVYGSEMPDRCGKPNPLIWLVAAHRLQVEPKRLVAFEDRWSGALSALIAGYGMVVAVPEDGNAEPFEREIAKYWGLFPEGSFANDSNRLVMLSSLSAVKP